MRERKSSTGSVTSTSTSLFSVSLRKSKTDNLSSIANGTVVQPLNSLVQLERLLWRVNNLISSDRSIVTGKSSKSLLLLKEVSWYFSGIHGLSRAYPITFEFLFQGGAGRDWLRFLLAGSFLSLSIFSIRSKLQS